MKIALYYPWLYLRSGGERTISEIVSRSRHSWTIFTHRYAREATFESLKSAHIVELGAPISVKRTVFHALQGAVRIANEKLPLEGYDALLVMCEGLGDLITLRNRQVPAFCYCFTPLRAAFDDHYQTFYLHMNGNGLFRRLTLRIGGAAFAVVDRKLWRNYRRIFSVSDHVKQRILNGRLAAAADIETLYPGIDPVSTNVPAIYEKYFFLPGRIMWTKNIGLGIDAFKLLLRTRPDLADFSLLISGFVDEKSKPYLQSLRECAADEPRIQFCVSPSDEELFAQYAKAYAVLCTPFNEDWGLTPIEAMAYAKPSIAVDRGGYQESILHGQTGMLVPPEPEAFCRAMAQFADHPEQVVTMGNQARKRSLLFTWQKFCNQLDSSLERECQSLAPAKSSSLAYRLVP
jgi:glycosyltransferase involved in cell wall biosynthesis